MAMCNMPLLIKAKMTKENYEKLLTEVRTCYTPKYIDKYYIWENGYFKLNNDYMDNFDIYEEAERIAKYIEPTEEQVGLIFAKGYAYTMADLYFEKGKVAMKNITEEPQDMNWSFEDYKKDYLRRKRNFLKGAH